MSCIPRGALAHLSALIVVMLVALSTRASATSPATTAREATAPTATLITPEQADRLWQRASRPFDQARQRLLQQIDVGDTQGPFHPDWASLQHYQAPAWFDDAKFGIFIHWGVYSVPAFANEWYPRNMYDAKSREHAHQVDTYGALANAGYKDFIPTFKAEHFDPGAWAALFREAGARYVVGVAEHTDGFAMYDSRLSRWTAVKMGPHRDVMADLGKAVHKAGLRFGLSSHRAEHDWFFDQGRMIDSDVNDPRYADFYGPAVPHMPAPDDGPDQRLQDDWTYVSPAWVDDWLARTSELEAYYHPDLIYLDWWMGHPAFRTALPKLLAYYYNAGAKRGGVVLTYKLNALAPGSATLDVERGQMADIQPRHWQTDTTISHSSWCYVKNDSYKSASDILDVLADVVSKNGNLLLDVGPRPDGTIVEQEQTVLRQIGRWMKTNGAAIYGSRPWRVYGEGPTRAASGAFQEKKTGDYTSQDFRFTRHGHQLYAIELSWPSARQVTIHSITPNDQVSAVRLLGSNQQVTWKITADGLTITTGKRPAGPDTFVYAVSLAD